MTPLQKKILDLSFYCEEEIMKNRCNRQCDNCKAIEDTCKQDFSEDET